MSNILSLGKIIVDKTSSNTISAVEIVFALQRHIMGDWGKVTKKRRTANQIAICVLIAVIINFNKNMELQI